MDATPLRIESSPIAFVADTRLEVLIDERVVYDGSFASGFTKTVSLPPGRHVLETRIHVGPMKRTRKYDFELPGGDPRQISQTWCARLKYSRLWGNFVSRLALATE